MMIAGIHFLRVPQNTESFLWQRKKMKKGQNLLLEVKQVLPFFFTEELTVSNVVSFTVETPDNI